MTLVGVEGIAANEHARVSWNIGKRCNYDCHYCPSILHDNVSPHISFENVEKIVERVIELYEHRNVWFSVTGGEPFLHPECLKIFQLIKSPNQISNLIVTSNGSFSSEVYLTALKWIDNLTISWHWEYVLPERLMRILSIIHGEFPKKLTLNIMMSPGKLEAVQEIYEWAVIQGIKVSIRKIHETVGFSEPEYSAEELSAIDSSSNHVNLNLYQSDSTVSQVNFNDLILQEDWNFYGWKCYAGVDSVYIDTKGDFYRGQCLIS